MNLIYKLIKVSFITVKNFMMIFLNFLKQLLINIFNKTKENKSNNVPLMTKNLRKAIMDRSRLQNKHPKRPSR